MTPAIARSAGRRLASRTSSWWSERVRAGSSMAPARRASSPSAILRAADLEAAHDLLRPRLVAGDVVLVKASRGIALDRRRWTALRQDLEP